MLAQPPLWLILIAFICALGPLVFIHEMGHYLVARWFGIGAETFSIGFGHEIAGWTDKRGTRWKVGWLPLGGYVKFVGDMTPASAPTSEKLSAAEEAVSFHRKPVWQRFLVVLAGPMANFLLAVLIFAAFFAFYGVPKSPNVVGAIQPGSPAATILRVGDRVTSIDGLSVDSFEDIQRIVALRPKERVMLAGERVGRPFSTDVVLGQRVEKDRFGQTYRIGLLGVSQAERIAERPSALDLVPEAVNYTVTITGSMIEGLKQIVTGRRPVEDLGGPLKIAQLAGQQASLGLFEFVQLVALFSINLGFINLLPVPMLDGGHLLFYAIEGARRRPVSLRTQDWAFRGGLAFLVGLLAFTTINDLGSFGLWERLGRLIG